MNLYKCEVPKLLRIFHTVQCIALLSIILLSSLKVKADSYQCIQVSEAWGEQHIITNNIVTVKAQTGLSNTEGYATVSGFPLISPDGKYAFFWQMMPHTDDEFGLYISSVADESPHLLHKILREDIIRYTFSGKQWSPDSRRLAYIYWENEQPFLAVVNVNSYDKQTKAITTKLLKKTSFADFSGWSADSAYIAASLGIRQPNGGGRYQFELQVWSADNLTQLSPNILLGSGVLDVIAPMAWSPTGHRLAIQLKNTPDVSKQEDIVGVAPLAIWSPEHGIEAISEYDAQLLPEEDTNGYDMIYWSPDGQHLRLHLNRWEREPKDIIFGVHDKKITKMSLSVDVFPNFITWTSDGVALMRDTQHNTETSELYLLSVNQNYRRTISRDTLDMFGTEVSPDGRYLAIQVKDKRVGLLDLQTFKQTLFKTSEWREALWSPNSKYVAFGLYDSGNIPAETDYIVNVNTLKVTDLDAKALGWLDDHWIIYVVERNGENHLEIRDLEKNTDYDLGKFQAADDNGIRVSDLYATISPDKEHIIAKLNEDTLVVISLKDGKHIEYTTQDGNLTFPDPTLGISTLSADLTWLSYTLAWSPDSSQIAFVEGMSSSNSRLVVLDSTGTELMRTPLKFKFGPPFIYTIVWRSCD